MSKVTDSENVTCNADSKPSKIVGRQVLLEVISSTIFYILTPGFWYWLIHPLPSIWREKKEAAAPAGPLLAAGCVQHAGVLQASLWLPAVQEYREATVHSTLDTSTVTEKYITYKDRNICEPVLVISVEWNENVAFVGDQSILIKLFVCTLKSTDRIQ